MKVISKTAGPRSVLQAIATLTIISFLFIFPEFYKLLLLSCILLLAFGAIRFFRDSIF